MWLLSRLELRYIDQIGRAIRVVFSVLIAIDVHGDHVFL